MARSFLAALTAVLVLGSSAWAHSPLLKDAITGNPQIKSIEALTFGPGGSLVIADGKGAQVVVIDVGHGHDVAWEKKEIANIVTEMAGRLGTDAKGITIKKMAVDPETKLAYVAVRIKASGKDVLLTVDGTGKVNEFMLDKVRHMRVPLGSDKITLATDVVCMKDRIMVAAQANENFGSKIVSIPLPLTKESKSAVFSTETYHVGHGKWETKAPIRTLIPYEENGKRYVVGSFTCTPIVKYALDDFKPGAKVKGVSVIELGTGNTPQDMFVYEKGGKLNILVNTLRSFGNKIGPSAYWTAKVDHDILQESTKINEKAMWRVSTNAQKESTNRAEVVPSFAGVTTMDRLDTNNAVAIRTDDKGGFKMVVLALP